MSSASKTSETSIRNKFDDLIISDVHLGSEVSRAKEALALLKRTKFKRLILLGDIFDDLNFGSLTKDHWNLLAYIRELSEQKGKIEVVWVYGNHDFLLKKVMKHLLGVDQVREVYEWEREGVKYLAIHGHQFDRFLVDNPILSMMASVFYRFLQQIGGRKQRFSRLVKRMSKSWLRLSEKVARGVMRYGELRGAQVVFAGHTHQALTREKEEIKYFNSGCWTDLPSTYIGIEGREVSVHEVN
jgi:UDP-2,3-diacylglucosamine pyrophosphatase LpxH